MKHYVLCVLIVLSLSSLYAEDISTTAPQRTNFQTIAADRKLWPPSVVLKDSAGFPIVLNGKQVGSVTLPAGVSVQLVSVNANGELVIAQSGKQTKILAEKTDFSEAAAKWQVKLAELKAQEEHQKQLQEIHDKEAAQEAAKAKAAEELKARTKTFYIEVNQVLSGGVLASPTGATIFVQGVNVKGLAEGNLLEIRAYRDGTYSFTDTRGASRTVEKWISVAIDTPAPPTSTGTSNHSNDWTRNFVSPLDRKTH